MNVLHFAQFWELELCHATVFRQVIIILIYLDDLVCAQAQGEECSDIGLGFVRWKCE